MIFLKLLLIRALSFFNRLIKNKSIHVYLHKQLVFFLQTVKTKISILIWEYPPSLLWRTTYSSVSTPTGKMVKLPLFKKSEEDQLLARNSENSEKTKSQEPSKKRRVPQMPNISIAYFWFESVVYTVFISFYNKHKFTWEQQLVKPSTIGVLL